MDNENTTKFNFPFLLAVLFHTLVAALLMLVLSSESETETQKPITAMQATLLDANQIVFPQQDALPTAKKLSRAERKQLARAQKKAEKHKKLLAKISAQITQKVIKSWIPPVSTSAKASCTIRIKLSPDGMVLSAEAVVPCDGDELFKRSAENAVNSASPLPVPKDSQLFEQSFKDFTFTFAPN
jgi:colicin import membrane protein